jgi:DNA excision repair protein ERCC-4
MLRVVPGVTGKNIKSLVVEMGSLREVANASVEELEPTVGKEAGRQIYRFFNKSVLV